MTIWSYCAGSTHIVMFSSTEGMHKRSKTYENGKEQLAAGMFHSEESFDVDVARTKWNSLNTMRYDYEEVV